MWQTLERARPTTEGTPTRNHRHYVRARRQRTRIRRRHRRAWSPHRTPTTKKHRWIDSGVSRQPKNDYECITYITVKAYTQQPRHTSSLPTEEATLQKTDSSPRGHDSRHPRSHQRRIPTSNGAVPATSWHNRDSALSQPTGGAQQSPTGSADRTRIRGAQHSPTSSTYRT